jgi:glucosamine--fructose-6-phosphate aminotransferase (isomerizing)
LRDGLASLPDALQASLTLNDARLEQALVGATSAFAIGRGPSTPIAYEAALKLKETCGINAEGYSAAEVLHGPMEVIGPQFPVLVFAASDAARMRTEETAERLRNAGAVILPQNYVNTASVFLDPIAMIQSFYNTAESAARLRGRNPDKPRLLSKITSTL